MSGVETKTKQRVTLQESDLGNINPDGVVNHQNVAVALSHRMLWKIARLREAHFNLYEEADGDLGKCELCFFFCHEDDILRVFYSYILQMLRHRGGVLKLFF